MGNCRSSSKGPRENTAADNGTNDAPPEESPKNQDLLSLVHSDDGSHAVRLPTCSPPPNLVSPQLPHPAVHNDSLSTPFLQSHFAYPESPQLLGPRNGDLYRQRTNSPQNSTTPTTSTIAAQLSSCFPSQITEEHLQQFEMQFHSSSIMAHPALAHPAAAAEPEDIVPYRRQLYHHNTDTTEVSRVSSAPELVSVALEDTTTLIAARRVASIQNVLSWIDSGSTNMMQDDPVDNTSSLVDDSSFSRSREQTLLAVR